MNKLKIFFSPMKGRAFPYWLFLILAVLANVVINYCSSAMNKYIFNGIEYAEYDTFYTGCLFGAVLIVLSFFYPFTRYFNIKVVRQIVYDIKVKMVDHLTKMKLQYFDEYHSADAIQKISNDAESLKTTYFTGVFVVCNLLALGTSSIFLMLIYNLYLGLVTILISALSVVITVKFNKKIKSFNRMLNEQATKLTAILSDIIAGFSVIKLFSGSKIVFDRYKNESQNARRSYLKIKNLEASMDSCNFFVGIVSSIGCILIGIVMVKYDFIDYGTIMAILSLQLSASYMFSSLGGAVSRLTASMTKFERIYEFMNMPEEEMADKPTQDIMNYETTQNNTFEDRNRAIIFSNVSFRYNDSSVVFENKSFTLDKGKKYILAGESGAGKSTIFKILLGLYKIDSGTIIIEGKEYSAYELNELRNKFSYVSQDCYLFSGTIYDNICCNNKSVSYEAVANAAKLSGIDAFIHELPEGYDTQLTMGGKNLSGGQRQRIAIARAFLKNAPIILMDEATSALDTENERNLNHAIQNLLMDKTVLMITHRLDTVVGFDGIINI